MNSKNIVIAVLALVLIGAVAYLFLNSGSDNVVVVEKPDTTETTPVEPNDGIGDGTEPINEVVAETRGDKSVIGTSVAGTAITAYHFGTGDTEILLVGGTHGGYSPNTAAVAEEAVSYFSDNGDAIPKNITLTIIPNLNPDGLKQTGTAGRFNTNEVDLNRNFDCEWSKSATWQSRTVSGGDAPFSEPEAAAIRDYVAAYSPAAAIVWFSAEGKVYPSACGDPSDATLSPAAAIKLAATFATAAGYPAAAEFDAYAITGDMVNWMAKQGIPAISVLLTDHSNTEWSKNQAGIEAVLNSYAE